MTSNVTEKNILRLTKLHVSTLWTLGIVIGFSGLPGFESYSQDSNCTPRDPQSRESTIYPLLWVLGCAPHTLGRTVRNTEINKHFPMQDTLKIRVLMLTLGKSSHSRNKRKVNSPPSRTSDTSLFKLVKPEEGFVPQGLK